ncbi:ABC transporter substrate-binding protein [Dermabacter sp. Marseille-Q3180]|uniref:ABC transporter substrate-binding protein n=1 Tax=Dermabacter sp. Marseille-Q3180 TaxID=2758090 RepID=UPI0020245A7A|nr:ABC transporter substrate-binding protein [Dermabacter sp. Marseille-Q3180]
MKRRTVLSAGLVAFVGAGCVPRQSLEDPPERPDIVDSNSTGQSLRNGGDLVMALSAEPDKLDPTTSSSLYTRYVMQTMCEKLYDLNHKGEIIPMLAAALPEISDDGREVVIRLREDAVFADGEPFNAEAVRITLDRHLNHEQSSRRSELGPITGLEAIEEFAVRVTFEKSFSPFTAALADRAGMMLSPKALEELGDDFASHPVGVGAFKFVERIPQTLITVERDPLYYDARNVRLDSVTYRIMADANIRAANIQSGDVHVADNISPQDIEAVKASRDINTLQVLSLGYQAITINLEPKDDAGHPLDKGLIATDERVRLAFTKAIDREALVNTVFNGWFDAACSPISPSSPFATEESTQCPEYDPEESKRLLEQAGAPVPYPITLKVSNSQDSLRFAQALQAQVKEAGFAISVVPMEYTAMLSAQDSGTYEAIQLGWSGRVDPHGNAYNFWTTDANNNYAAFSDRTLDDLLTKASEVTDLDERSALYGAAVKRMQETNPVIYLYRQRSLTAYRANLVGVSTYADGVVKLSHAAFIEGEQP